MSSPRSLARGARKKQCSRFTFGRQQTLYTWVDEWPLRGVALEPPEGRLHEAIFAGLAATSDRKRSWDGSGGFR